MIDVINLHDTKVLTGEYIGRPMVLGNPWRVGHDGSRQEVIDQYRQFLWEVVKVGRRGELAPLTAAERSSLTEWTKCLRWGQARVLASGEAGTLAGGTDGHFYRRAVWSELLRLLALARSGETLTLQCYCKPQACHGDVLKSCLEWMANKGTGEKL